MSTMATQAATQATQDALCACDGHNTSALLAGSNFEEEVGALSDITPSQPSTSQITRPEPEPDDVFGFRIADADAFTFEKREDTATKLIEAARLAESRAEFLKAMFSGDLFAGMMDEDDMYRTVQSKLSAIHDDSRTHRELATRYDFATSSISPKPYQRAAENICLKEGLHL